MSPTRYVKIASDTLYHSRLNKARARVIARTVDWRATNAAVARLIDAARPALVCRMGSIETTICWRYVRKAFWPEYFGVPYEPPLMSTATVNAGVLAPDGRALDRFASIYCGALPFADVIGIWSVKGMAELIDRLCAADAVCASLSELEPWDALDHGEPPWTQALAGRTVLVVHPFAASIEAQYRRRREVKLVRDLMPDFELKTLVPPMTNGGQSGAGGTWESHLQELTAKVAATRFDVAVIGCGAYGLPLGAFVKQTGRIAVHLGGATQLLFGIRGKRWDAQDHFAARIDDTWVRPLAAERPPGADQVEDACYW